MSHSFLIPGCSLRQLILFLVSIHAEKNTREGVLNTPIGALGFLALADQGLLRELTKEEGRRLNAVLSRWFMHFFVLVQTTGLDAFLHSLETKYPAAGCSYCSQPRCKCGPVKIRREDSHPFLRPSPTQSIWTLWHWQGHQAAVYGLKNFYVSIDRLLAWRAEEMAELTGLINWRSRSPADETEQRHQSAISNELADIFMRTLAVATKRQIDVEHELVRLYRVGCWRCQQRFCVCQQHAGHFDDYLKMVATRPSQ